MAASGLTGAGPASWLGISRRWPPGRTSGGCRYLWKTASLPGAHAPCRDLSAGSGPPRRSARGRWPLTSPLAPPTRQLRQFAACFRPAGTGTCSLHPERGRPAVRASWLPPRLASSGLCQPPQVSTRRTHAVTWRVCVKSPARFVRGCSSSRVAHVLAHAGSRGPAGPRRQSPKTKDAALCPRPVAGGLPGSRPDDDTELPAMTRKQGKSAVGASGSCALGNPPARQTNKGTRGRSVNP